MKKLFVALLTTLALCTVSMAERSLQIIVRLASNNTDAQAIAQKFGLVVIDRTTDGPFVLFAQRLKRPVELLQFQLSRDPRVLWAEDNVAISNAEGQSAIKGSTMPVVGGRSELYQQNNNLLQQINWSPTLADSTGRTVKLAILDTGLSVTQQYLWDKTVASANFVESGVADDGLRNTDSNQNGVPDEGAGHGTMVAGVADQIAPNVPFVIARVADSDGNATAWTLTKGISFAVAQNCEIANISLGSPTQVAALNDVLDYCEENNLTVVSAIGNANVGSALYPARATKVVCVSGLLPDNHKAPFSNWDGHCDAAAPATGIISQWYDGHMGTWSGTSFASPMVAAALADCLRRTTPQSSSRLNDAVNASGVNIDNVNPQYDRKLGTLLDIQNLNTELTSGHRRGKR